MGRGSNLHNLRDDEHPRGFQDQVPVEHIVLVEKVSCGEVAAMRHAKVDAYQLAPWRGHEQRKALKVTTHAIVARVEDLILGNHRPALELRRGLLDKLGGGAREGVKIAQYYLSTKPLPV